jgi:anti-sigma factor RsiW
MTTISGHLTDAMAQRLVDGLLDAGRDAGAEAHAASCPACAALVESYRLLGDALDDLDVPALPTDFTASVLQRIDEVESAQARERRLAVAVLAGILLVAVGALVAAGAGGLGTTVGQLADQLGQATQALRIGRGVVPSLVTAVRLPLLVGAAAVAIPLLFGLTRLMPAPRTEIV